MSSQPYLVPEGALRGRRVFITGGLGFIGSNLARRCLELGAQVLVYDCLDPRSGGNMHNIRDIEADLEIVLNDIRSFEGVCAQIRGRDLLFSCAAFTSHPNSMKEPFVDVDVNCKGVLNLLEAARRFNPTMKVVHVGTSTQIGRMLQCPVTEVHPEFPRDIYSANKMVSEKYVLIYGCAHHLRTTVVRLPNTYGPRACIRNPDLGFVNYFIGLGLQNKALTVFGDGRQRRNLCYVADAVEALIMAGLSDQSNGEVLFAATDQQYAVAELAAAISAQLGGRVANVPWPPEYQAIEIGDAEISNAKIRQLLGWRPVWSLSAGLDQVREYYRPCLSQYL